MPELPHQIIAQNNRLIVLGVSRTIKERHGFFPCSVQYRLPTGGIGIQFVFVALVEFVPTLRVMPEPVAKRIARRNVLEPAVEAQRFLPDTPQPEAVDKEMHISFIASVSIDALNIDCVFHDSDTPVMVKKNLLAGAAQAQRLRLKGNRRRIKNRAASKIRAHEPDDVGKTPQPPNTGGSQGSKQPCIPGAR